MPENRILCCSGSWVQPHVCAVTLHFRRRFFIKSDGLPGFGSLFSRTLVPRCLPPRPTLQFATMGMIKNSAVGCQPILVAGVIYFLGGALILRADEATEKGRAIFKAHQQSVVTLELTIRSKMTLPGVDTQAREAHQEATGTVLDASGLIVTALAPTDPTQMLENML